MKDKSCLEKYTKKSEECLKCDDYIECITESFSYETQLFLSEQTNLQEYPEILEKLERCKYFSILMNKCSVEKGLLIHYMKHDATRVKFSNSGQMYIES